MVSCIIGSAVSGKELFGRKKEIEQIWSAIKTGSVLLTSPRRFGKTSLTFEIKESPRPEYAVYYLDVEYLDRPENFIVEIMDKTHNLKDFETKFKDKVFSFMNSIKEIDVPNLKLTLKERIKPNWANNGNHIFEKIVENSDKTLVFVIDELPTMILNIMNRDDQGPETAKLFLSWLRQLRIAKNIKFVICGSIGIEQVVAECGSQAAINDLYRISICPLDKNESLILIRDLLDGFQIKYDDVLINKIYDTVGTGVPFFIKILVQAITDLLKEEEGSESKKNLDESIITHAYQKNVLGVPSSGYFEHYFSRLDNYYKSNSKLAKTILDELAIRKIITYHDLEQLYKKQTNSNDVAPLYDLLNRLESDFYIMRKHEIKTCQFNTKILGDLWRQRRGL